MSNVKFVETLVFVSGATPQIITESIYALSQSTPPVYAGRIYIITTSVGKRVISDALIAQGKLQGLIAEYDLPPLSISESSFVVIKGANGDDLDDIRTVEANEAAGDQIVDLIRRLSADPTCRLHCSLAGGRKTMSFYLGAALQLFGRQWDRLYHVLVTPAFETHPDFFYKPKEPRVIESVLPGGSRKMLNTDDAEIALAELPFIRLSGKLSLQGHDFKALVRQGQTGIDTAAVIPEISVSLAQRSAVIGGVTVEFLPIQIMIYCMILRQKVRFCKYPELAYCIDCTACYLSVAELTSRQALEDMAKDYASIYGSRDKGDELREKWPHGLAPEVLRQNISKLNRAIKEAMADEAVSAYYVVRTNGRRWGNSCYGVRIDKGKILLT